jgi:hypothetical protein
MISNDISARDREDFAARMVPHLHFSGSFQPTSTPKETLGHEQQRNEAESGVPMSQHAETAP